MYFVLILALIVIGAVAASGLVERKVPQVKSLMEMIKPHSEWVGLVSLVIGLYWLLKTIFYLGWGLKYAFVFTLIKIAAFSLLIILGFLLAQPLLMQFIGKNENASEAAAKMKAKFTPLKEKLGIASIAFGFVILLIRVT